jgi:uncharacterized protein (DUF433 family)
VSVSHRRRRGVKTTRREPERRLGEFAALVRERARQRGRKDPLAPDEIQALATRMALLDLAAEEMGLYRARREKAEGGLTAPEEKLLAGSGARPGALPPGTPDPLALHLAGMARPDADLEVDGKPVGPLDWLRTGHDPAPVTEIVISRTARRIAEARSVRRRRGPANARRQQVVTAGRRVGCWPIPPILPAPGGGLPADGWSPCSMTPSNRSRIATENRRLKLNGDRRPAREPTFLVVTRVSR